MRNQRTYLFEDRVKAHAIYAGHGLERMTTTSVGKLHFLLKRCYILTLTLFFCRNGKTPKSWH